MREISEFWWLCGKRAAAGASAFANDWQWMFGTPALAGLIWLANKWVGAGTMTLSQDVVGVFLAAGAAFFLTWLVKFIVGLVKEPAALFREQAASNRMMRDEVGKLLRAEKALKQLSDYYHDGRRQYSEYSEFRDWKSKMNEWVIVVEKFLEENFSVSELHEFRKSGAGSAYSTEWSWEGVEHNEAWRTQASVTSRLSALNDIIRGGTSAFLPVKTTLAFIIGEVNEQTRIQL